jgi:colanic acid/amylovoran biosynthesis glycosyltransferase
MNQEKPHVLMLTSSFPNSPGNETCGYIRDFARRLATDFNVNVLAPRDSQSIAWPDDSFTLVRSRSLLPERFDPFQATADFNCLRTGSVSLKFAAAVSFASYCSEAMRLARYADVIVSHWMMPCGLAGALIHRLLGKPHIVIEHSGALHTLAQMRSGRRLARFIVNGSNRIVTVSRDLQHKLIALCPNAKDKADVIPMGIHADTDLMKANPPSCRGGHRSLPQTENDLLMESRVPQSRADTEARPYMEKTILFIGRLTEVKGVDVLLRAVQGIEGVQVLIAGDGDRRTMLEPLAQQPGINVRFLGQIEAGRRDELLAACDMVVIPSRVLAGGRTEGMPVVALEAMAAGRAVIASRTGGLGELITDGHNGLLVDPGDARQLAERIHLVLSDATRREHLEQNARRTAIEYSWTRIGARYSELIKDCLRNDAITTDQHVGAGSAAC